MSFISWLKSLRGTKAEIMQSKPEASADAKPALAPAAAIATPQQASSGSETAFAPRFGGGYGRGGVPDQYGRFGGPR